MLKTEELKHPSHKDVIEAFEVFEVKQLLSVC